MRIVALICFLLAGLVAWGAWGPRLLPQPPAPSAPAPSAGPALPRLPGLPDLPDLPDLHWPRLHPPGPDRAAGDRTDPNRRDTDRPAGAEPQGAPIAAPVERILIEKSARRMTIWQKGAAAPRVMTIALGSQPVGDKQRQGDGKTPEGLFHVDRRNAHSDYHLSLGLDYPRPQDRARARAAGVSPGGDIMIHGQPNQVAEGYKVRGDWTAGCVAVTNPEIAELFAHTAVGTPVEIRP